MKNKQFPNLVACMLHALNLILASMIGLHIDKQRKFHCALDAKNFISTIIIIILLVLVMDIVIHVMI